jgi:arylsulfatase A-like enzyme/Tfp pilus assembly protein PilF
MRERATGGWYTYGTVSSRSVSLQALKFLAAGMLICAAPHTGFTQTHSARAPAHAGSGQATEAHRQPPNIVLITIDTARADRMGFMGSKLGLTPNLDAFAKNATVFTHAYSQVPLTSASHATILTGTYPQFHHVNDAGVTLAADLPYAPALLKRHGYHTAAFVGCVILDPKAGGAPGFDRGFETYDAGFHARRQNEDRYASVERRGADVVAHAAAWLNKRPQGPFFVWVHLYDPHAPYDPPEPYRSRYAAYDGEIAYADAAVGQLLDTLRALKLYDSSTIAVMADHGEGLGEHGERGHGIFLYDPTIHVPLLLKVAGHGAGAARVEAPVELVDVLPTLLESAGVTPPAAVQGKSLEPLIDAKSEEKTDASRIAYAETDYPQRAYGWSSLRSLRSGKYLFIEAPRKELYDRTADPSEAHNLAASLSAVAATLNAKTDGFRQKTASTRTAASAALDPEQEAKLRALGYVASGENSGGGREVSGVDPKDKIEVANRMADASLALEDNRYPAAIQELETVVSMDQTVYSAYSTLGTAYLTVGDVQRAIPVLRKAVALKPDSVMGHYQLGMALYQSGDLTAAAPEFEAAVKYSPNAPDMRFSLAAVYVRLNRVDEGKKELEKALQLKPNLFQANMMMGQILVKEKKASAALPYLQKAVAAQPNLADGHFLLAEAYRQLGDKSRAAQEQATGERLKATRG